MSEAQGRFLPIEERLPALAGGGWRGALRGLVEGLLGLPEIRRRANRSAERLMRGEHAFEAFLAEMGFGMDAGGVTEAIPREGPVVLVANHPFGGAESLVLPTLAIRVRQDVKVLGNVEVLGLPGFSEWVFPLEILGGEGARRKNFVILRQALQHLRAGGLLVVFPGGAVSHWQWKTARVEDPPWPYHTARMLAKSGAAVLPVRFFGQNGPLFQLLGMVHPLLRSALILRAFLVMRGRTIRCRAGKLLKNSELPREAEETTATLRAAVYGVFPGDGN